MALQLWRGHDYGQSGKNGFWPARTLDDEFDKLLGVIVKACYEKIWIERECAEAKYAFFNKKGKQWP